MRTHRARGFSFFEVLSTIAILGVLVVVAVVVVVNLGRCCPDKPNMKGNCDGIHASLVGFYADHDTFPPATGMLLPKKDMPGVAGGQTVSDTPYYELLELAKSEVVDLFSPTEEAIVYVPVNSNQFKAWKRQWDDPDDDPLTPEPSVYATELPSNAPGTPTLAQPERYDAYVLLSVGPPKKYFGPFSAGPTEHYYGLLGREVEYATFRSEVEAAYGADNAANLYALRTYYLATKGIDDEKNGWQPLLHYDTRRGGKASEPLPVNPADTAPRTRTPEPTAGTYAYGPYIYIPAGL
jgi:prepilin-type N-terminal cleavage/methylation domain-containing protein